MLLVDQFKIVAVAVGVAALCAVGSTTFVGTGDNTLTLLMLLLAACALATLGPKAMNAVWQVLGDFPIKQTWATANYDRTTRGRGLARKLRRFVGEANAPVTILVVGTEYLPNRHGKCRWTDALRQAASQGATVCQLLPQTTTDDERAFAQALSQESEYIQCLNLTGSDNGPISFAFPILAWSGERTAPNDALFWLEGARDTEAFTDAELRNGRNLRRNPGMLEEFIESIEEAARRSLPPKTPRHHSNAETTIDRADA